MFWFDKEDDKALAVIMREYRCETKSQAVRLALKMAATGRSAYISDRAVQVSDYRLRKRKPSRTKQRHILLRIADLAQDAPELPEDFAERFDEYRLAKLRADP
jgi:hypothetical protein